MLTFDPVEHRYAWNGAAVPGVTSVIRSALGDPFASVPPAVLEHKRMIGTAAHLACHLDDAGKLDEASVHPEVAPRLEAWRKFRRDVRSCVFMSEEPLYAVAHGYAGMPDRGLLVEPPAAAEWVAVVDLKTGLPGPAAALQTAAYEHLVAQRFPHVVGSKRIRRFALQALSSGKYRMTEYTNPADWRDFLACLAVHRLKERIAA